MADDDRLGLVFRVGVTGHRWVRRDDEIARQAVGAALEDAFARCSNRSTPWTRVRKAVVSSLAEGADRLAAEWAVEKGLRLEVVLPMEPEAYVADFATEESRSEFRHLVHAAAAVIVVPSQETSPATTPVQVPRWDRGSRVRRSLSAVLRCFGSARVGDPACGQVSMREDMYRTAGHAVVERSDVLLAVWDGRPAKGVGGTGEIVATAGRLGVPVTWVRAQQHPGAQAAFHLADPGDAAVEGLRRVPDRAGPLSDRAFRLLDAYNRAAVPLRRVTPLGPAADRPARQLSDQHRRADLMAVRARDAMLRGSRALYTLAVVAVAIASGQLVFFHEQVWVVWFEFAALVLIMGILYQARRSRLLDRWISTRTLAEQLRSGYFLAMIGASPAPGSTRTAVDDPTEATEWARRAAREVLLRTAARTPAPIDLETGRSLLLDQWLDPQLRYQQQAEETARRREDLSSRVTVALFGVSVVAALLHVLEVFRPEGAPEYWTFLSVVAPAAAAAVSGYTAQREYVRQRSRAGRMVQRLTEGRASVVRAATMSELRRAAEAVDLVMQGESADWLSATRLHELRIP